MKHYYLTLIILLASQLFYSQNITIPDANFKNALIELGVDTNNDNEIQISEAETITTLDISSKNISSLSGIEYFVNIQSLNINSNYIPSIDISSLTELKSFSLRKNEFSILDVSSLSKLETLNCSNNNLTNLILNNTNSILELRLDYNPTLNINSFLESNFGTLTNLKFLYTTNNNLSTLNVNGLTNLELLNCSSNLLTELNVNNLAKLLRLTFSDNKFTTLNINSNSIEYLTCPNNLLSDLDVSLVPNLKWLSCGYNQLTQLNISSLTNLEVLSCANNLLSSLTIENLPHLNTIYVQNNQLINMHLKNLNNLQILQCNNNNLESIDVSGLSSLTSLNCYNNQLTSIIPNPSLKLLRCADNKLKTLDLSSVKKFETLECNNNELTSLFLKNGEDDTTFNGSSITMKFQNNPDLEYICSDDFEIATIQTLLDSYGYTNCEVNTYCSFIPGGQSFIIEGQNLVNQNGGNCDDSVPFYSHIKYSVNSDDINGVFISNNSGSYKTSVKDGDYTITPLLENSEYFTISPSSFVASFPTDGNIFNQDFCITPNGVHNDLEIFVIPVNPARPGFDTDYKIIYKNKGNQSLSGSIEINFQDDLMDLITSNPTVDTQSTNLLTWNYNNLQPFESKEILVTFNINTPLETPSVNDGDILTFSANIYPITGDETEVDNTFNLNQTVVNSYDPNDKTCLEGNTITPDLIGEYVHYLIRCENTGTAEAVNVVIKDVIDTTKFDINSLIITDSSHNMETRINSNIVEFVFENINLPFDDANNDGYVAFKIKTLSTLQVGDVFENEAEIYFDYNLPIITNKFQTQIEKTLGLNKLDGFNNILKIYPNPAENHILIESKEPIESLSIYDISGRLITRNSYLKNKLIIDVHINNLLSGTYFVKVKTEKNEYVNQIIKK